MFFFPQRIASLSTLALILFAPLVQAETNHQPRASRIEGIRFWSFGDVTRVAVETSGDYKLYTEQIERPSRVFFDLTGLQPPNTAQHNMQTIVVGDHRIRQIRVARITGEKTRIVFDLDCPVEVISSQLVNPDRLMIEIRPRGTSLPALNARSFTAEHKVDLSSRTSSAESDISDAEMVVAKNKSIPPPAIKTPKDDPTDAYHPGRDFISAKPVLTASIPTVPATVPNQTLTIKNPPPVPLPTGVSTPKDDSFGDRSLVRVFGLKMGRVVIDAGHGGHDSGTIGPNGLQEKELVLDVALRLGALITRKLGAEVVYTRSADVFIPLEQRTRIANEQKADLFISVHANSSPEPTATGVETYYFNLTSDKSGVDLATRENATADSSISDLGDLLHRAVLQTKREESREFAQKVQASLTATSQRGNQVKDRGVRQAPFVVLIGATMPSILAEIGFVSNPRDERQLRKTDQRQKIAEALLKGVVQYANSLSHIQMARAGTE